jgi:Trypsin-like peptidase domain
MRALHSLLFTLIAAVALGGCSAIGTDGLFASPQPGEWGAAKTQLEPVDQTAAASECRQTVGINQAKAERLIATIRSGPSDPASGAPTEDGAGIVIADDPERTLVVTARHVVETDVDDRVIDVQIKGRASHRATVRWMSNDPVFRDLAVLAVEREPQEGSLVDAFGILAPVDQPVAGPGFVFIGNPAGRGVTTTAPGDGRVNDASSVQIAVAVDQGYSGGGIFDPNRQLVGLTIADSQSAGLGYPIASVLTLLKAQGIVVALSPATESKRGILLGEVTGEPPELVATIRQNFHSALESGGLDPDCNALSAYRLGMRVAGRHDGATEAVIEVFPALQDPKRTPVVVEPYKTLVPKWPWSTWSAVEPDMKPLVKRIVSAMR